MEVSKKKIKKERDNCCDTRRPAGIERLPSRRKTQRLSGWRRQKCVAHPERAPREGGRDGQRPTKGRRAAGKNVKLGEESTEDSILGRQTGLLLSAETSNPAEVGTFSLIKTIPDKTMKWSDMKGK